MTSPASGQTATTVGARDHARAQGDTVVGAHADGAGHRRIARYPTDVDPSRLVWAETDRPGRLCPSGAGPGTTVRLSDVEADACAHVLLFRADQPWERLCVADTVKVQWQAYTSSGQLLLSDQGRVLATVTADSSGCHDSICGTTTLVGQLRALRIRQSGGPVAGRARALRPGGGQARADAAGPATVHVVLQGRAGRTV